jgi:hypothetical protein
MTTRGAIIAAIEARFEVLDPLGEWVRSWSVESPLWDELPVLRVSDPSSEEGPPAYGRLGHTLSVPVEVILPGGTDLEEMRGYAATLLAAVATDPTWGGLATGTDLASVAVSPGERDRVSAGVTVTLRVAYETALWAI